MNSNTVFFSHAGYLLNTTVPCVGFSVAGLDRAKIRLSSVSNVFVYCCRTSIQSQSVKMLLRSDKHIITFEAIEKCRYGLEKLYRDTLTR